MLIPAVRQATVHDLRDAVHGAVLVPSDDGYDDARPERSMPFLLNAVTGWYDATGTDAHVGWGRRIIACAEHPSSGRSYVNYLGDPADAYSSYGAETHARLVALKNEYDSTNVFRLNQNVAPTAPFGS